MTFFIYLIQVLVQLITILIIVYVFLGYFLAPYHPVRQFLSRFVEPLLAPIRRIMPQTGMIDFSPLVLLLIVQLLGTILVRLLR
jgi:YggT family protein